MPAKPLSDLCVGVCLSHIKLLSSIGPDLTYQQPYVRHILNQVSSPQQLREIELNSPQLQGETGELWQALIQRDFMDSRKKHYVPKNPKNWHKVYQKYRVEQEESLAKANLALQSAFAGIKKEQDQHLVKVYDGGLPRPPKSGRSLGVRRTQGKDVPSTLTFTAGSRTKMTSGKSVMKRARREASEILARRGRLAIPTGFIPNRPNQIRQAPKGMVDAHRVAAQPDIRPSDAVPADISGQNEAPWSQAMNEDSEAGYAVLSDSEEEEYGELDPLFDDAPNTPPKRSSFRRQTSPECPPPVPVVSRKTRLLPGKPGTPARIGKTVLTNPNISSPTKSLANSSSREPGGQTRKPVAPSQIRKTRPTADAQTTLSSSSQRASRDEIPQNKLTPRLQSSSSSTAWSAELSAPRASLPTPETIPRKRKAVDIFMRPKKRVM